MNKLIILVAVAALSTVFGSFGECQVSVSQTGGPVGGMFKVPGPSIVTMQGNQLLVQKRLSDGTLLPPSPFKMQGIAYSPADVGDNVTSLSAARKHLIEGSFDTDFPMIAQMNGNTVKTYVDMGVDNAAKKILDAAYANGLWVLVTLVPDGAHMVGDPSNSEIVNMYKNHPALLGWIVGNEFNLNFFYVYPDITLAAQAAEATVQLVKSLDPNHIVASSLGFTNDDFALGSAIVSINKSQGIAYGLMPSVDLWSLNLYRAKNLDAILYEWRHLTGGEPFFLGEFGTDSWNTMVGSSDELTQANTYASLWDQVHRNLSAANPAHHLVGAIAFEWNDEWWKWTNPNFHDHGGYYLGKSFPDYKNGGIAISFFGHPDFYANEEHFGVVDVNRVPKQAYFALQSEYKLTNINKAPIVLSVKSQGGGSSSYYWMSKDDVPFMLRYGSFSSPNGGRGINIAVVDRSSGGVIDVRNFDTWLNPSNCSGLNAFLSSLSPGDIVVATATDTAFGTFSGNCTPLSGFSGMSQCLSAFQQIGSTQLGGLHFWQPWVFIGVAGGGVPALAEAVGSGTCGSGPGYVDAQVSVQVALDVDRDGISDSLDLDNDNDGKLDVVEKANGTDILDPNV